MKQPEIIQNIIKSEPVASMKKESKKETNEIVDNKIPGQNSWTEVSQQKRIDFLRLKTGQTLSHISGDLPDSKPDTLKGNIEQYIGMTKIPTGIIGPILVQGKYAKGDFYVPMATSEGALISSYNRGAKATRESGGVVSICLLEAIQRAPSFKFQTLIEATEFAIWVQYYIPLFKEIVKKTSRFAVLTDLKINIEGNVVILIFEYSTGEAAGQNMVTICTNAICNYIIDQSPIAPIIWFIEGNFSGDKKATVTALNHVRGKKVSAESIIPNKIIRETLNTTSSKIAQYWITSVIGTVQSGGIGLQGHFANGLTAMFLATGQDVACVAEAANGITRMEVLANDDLYISVTLPSLVVGTIGGGTWLATQKDCLDILGCSGPGSARKLAEIMAATILGGELSIAAAMASHDFVRAHRNLGRSRQK